MFEVKTVDSVTNLLNLNMGALKKRVIENKTCQNNPF